MVFPCIEEAQEVYESKSKQGDESFVLPFGKISFGF